MEEPRQAVPPQAGVGLLQIRVRVPLLPQDTEQLLHPLHPPFTGVQPPQAEQLEEASPQESSKTQALETHWK
jgi:hypothetical protein